MPAAAIGVGSSLIGGILGSQAAGNAAAAQVNAENTALAGTTAAGTTALATEKNVYQNDQTAAQPYQAAGSAAVGQLGSAVLAGAPSSAQVLAQDPGYQFRLDQGQQALDRAAAAGGSIGSGGAMKAAAAYGQNYASSEYGNAFNRYMQSNQQRFSQLSSIAGLGSQTNAQMDSAGSSYSGQAANTGMTTAQQQEQEITGAGNAQASGYMGAANAWSGALGGIGKATDNLDAGDFTPGD